MTKPSSKDTKQDREVPGVALLYKAFRVMDAIAEAKTPPRIGDLLAATDLSKGTLYRLLQALVDRRYLRHDPSDQSYRLGTKLFDMAHTVWESFDLRSAASSELIALRDRLGETTRLSILDGYDVLYIDQVDATSELRVASAVGSRAPIHASSSGKAMLSKLEPVQRSEILSRLDLAQLTPATITNEKELRQQIDLVTARGYAISMEERVPGIASVSAPILDASDRPIGALTVTGPAFRLAWDRLDTIGRDLIDA
ncbi:MAG: IclR family transcriptional regulator, partial [Maritimibacter sp.]|nr:IclR family transcriptional regulator [Maritimibacter sp.]